MGRPTTALLHTCFRLSPMLVLAATTAARAQIVVTGVEDREVYTDRVSFVVASAAGWSYAAALNGAPVEIDADVEVDRADYYELEVEREPPGGGAPESLLVRFIVRASARGNSEWGLPPWVPLPPIPSAPAELEGARLRIVAPRDFPPGVEVPVIALVEDADGNRVGVNGEVAVEGFPDHPVRLLRGVGSRLMPAAAPGATLSLRARVHELDAPGEARIDPSTEWQPASGEIHAATVWAEGSRIHVTGDLTVAAGATLTIGAGAVVKVGPGVEIEVEGTLEVAGTPEDPVVFAPESRSAPWGGFLLRTAGLRAVMRGAILTGSGADPDWFDNTPGSGSSHRDEQPLLYLSDGARAELTDCYLIDNFGQAGHGESSFLDMTGCVVQRCITTGQYNGGSVTLERCALVEFPGADAPFEDDDNDGLYLTGGAHSLTDCLIGWALDDGIDAGSGSGGSVAISGCWVESCYHEGMAWSEARDADVRDTAVLNCGQGIECGFDDPDVLADHCLSTANLIGARFGDNYDWDYDGFLRVTNSLLLFNRRDIWGRAWDDWEEHLSQMDLTDNYLSTPDALHPDNTTWDPVAHAALLEPFLPAPDGTVGVGIATRGAVMEFAALVDGIPVRLSTFTRSPVMVDYEVASDAAVVASGTLEFVAGETVKRIRPPIDDPGALEYLCVSIDAVAGAELTGRSEVYVVRDTVLIPTGSVWKYHARGVDLGRAWRELDYDDAGWEEGAAELGFGDDDEETEIDGGPSDARYPTVYFRRAFDVADPSAFRSLTVNLRRDDGALVYLNGVEVFRSNMEEGEVTFATLAPDTTDSETAYYSAEVDPGLLRDGRNVVAVEVHQATATSSDLSFELELIGAPVLPPQSGDRVRFARGDANGDLVLDISDPVRVLVHLFLGGVDLPCADAADANDDGAVAVSDAVFALDYLFRRGPRPPAPGPSGCGLDPGSGDGLDCGTYPACP